MSTELPVIQQPSPRVIRRITPLIKPTSRDCNLACDYCFYLYNPHVYKGSRSRRMSDEVMERFTENYLRIAPDEAMFAWQGGEPTMMGVDFFRRAFAAQKKYARPGQRTVNAFQTNAVLINDEIAELFAENEVLIGVSLDGPESIHDRHRKSAGKTGTWRKVMSAIERLQKAGAEYNILCVIHSDNYKRAKDIYSFYRSQGFTFMQFIPCTEPELSRRGKPTGKISKYSVTPEQYSHFLLEIFDLWEADVMQGNIISVRFFDHVLNTLAGYGTSMCLFERQCDQQFVLEADGRIYPCDFFVQAKWAMGNILETDLDELLSGPKYQAFIEQSLQMPNECRSCHYLGLCHGGCPRHRLLLGDNPADSNYFCETYKTFYDRTITRFEEIVRRLTSQQAAASSPQSQ